MTFRENSATAGEQLDGNNRDYDKKFGPYCDVPASPLSSSSSSLAGDDDDGTDLLAPSETMSPPPYHGMPDWNTSNGDDTAEPCHPFWTAWHDIARGAGLITAAGFKVPLVVVDGVAKGLWSIPLLCGDETARDWPDVTGVRTGCVAAAEGLYHGLYDGLTGWVILPYKGARKGGVKGFVKGCAKGLVGLVVKPASGALGLVGHPLFGVYKEALAAKVKVKVVVRRERRPRRGVVSLV
ncbi:Uu.00g068080.m01.CDS01 [Anthostomella pinea]|uniref:Uu.00g068080.m01.CDS01 n=1 Tax=Anthostomella pinea TaxID=933095 RepID=A0AAI8VU96_9PEZI|nr:Uu.00g068080.m01.CDS01 [Anthostomella pinea]